MNSKTKDKLASVYRQTASVLLNTFLLLIAVNIILAVVYYFLDTKKNGAAPNTETQDMYPMAEYDTAAFNGLPIDDIREINTDFNTMARQGLYYQPWVQFSEPLFKSKMLNVITDETGIPMRHTSNPENRQNLPVYKVYCMGGSTTFGYNVNDEQTFPYFLSRQLNDSVLTKGKQAHIEVRNYGRGYYSPSEEIQLLIDLLKLGHRPSLVVFMDGLNVGQAMDIPYSTETVVNRFYDVQFRRDNMSLKPAPSKIPMIRLADEIREKFFPKKYEQIQIEAEENPDALIPFYVNRFLQDKKIIQSVCDLYRIPCLFFSQPVAPYNYPTQFYRSNPFAEDSTERILRGKFLQTLLGKDTEIISLHHLFADWNQKAVVDYSHYSPAFNEFVAQHISRHIDLNQLTSKESVLDTLNSTGAKRNIADKIHELMERSHTTNDQLKIGN